MSGHNVVGVWVLPVHALAHCAQVLCPRRICCSHAGAGRVMVPTCMSHIYMAVAMGQTAATLLTPGRIFGQQSQRHCLVGKEAECCGESMQSFKCSGIAHRVDPGTAIQPATAHLQVGCEWHQSAAVGKAVHLLACRQHASQAVLGSCAVALRLSVLQRRDRAHSTDVQGLKSAVAFNPAVRAMAAAGRRLTSVACDWCSVGAFAHKG